MLLEILIGAALGAVAALSICLVIHKLNITNIRRAARQVAIENDWYGNLDCIVMNIGDNNATLELGQNGECLTEITVQEIKEVAPDVEAGTTISLSV